MLRNYFLFALRTFQRNKVSFVINLVGMSIALGCAIAAYVNFEFNSGFDKIQPNAADVHRISFLNVTEERTTPYGVCPMPAANLIKESLKPGDQLIRYISKAGQFRIKDELFEKEFVYADINYPEVFTIDMLYGERSLTNKSHVLISDRLAQTYFGKTDVVGEPLTQIISGQPREFVIGGVYKRFPANSSFRFELITAYDNYFTDPSKQAEGENDWKRWVTVFLYLKDPGSIKAIDDQLKNYIKPQNEARPDLQISSFYVEPFIGMGTRAVKEKNQGHWLNMPMPPAAVFAPFTMAVFILLVACFNVTNNAIAIAARRLKEIGIRKVVGGRRKELIIQFLSETFLFCLIALGFGMVLAEYFIAGWDLMWPGLEFSIQYKDNLDFFIMLVILLLFTSILAGAYPAFYISKFKPISILRGTTRFGGTNLFTKSLLVFQFSISLAAVIFALAFYFNAKFQKEYDLGYSYQSVIQVPVEDEAQFDQLKANLISNPAIRSIGGSQHHIYQNSVSAAARYENRRDREIEMLGVGDGYFETVNVRLIAGRGFTNDSESDVKESIIVNEEFVRVFELGNEPIGKRITIYDTVQCYVVGVVKDVYLRALFEPISPVVFRYVPVSNFKFLVASTDPTQLQQVNEQIEKEWKALFPFTLYPGRLMEARMVMALEHFDNVIILYSFLGLVAIIMSVSGLYSLVSINLKRRTKELGIRKILGASIPHLAIQSSKLFIIIMIIAFVIGTTMGSLMVNKLMDTVWEYYVATNFKVISLAIIVLATISLGTIGLQIRKATISNPADALRHE
jgi:putative ABC transport system permease protein